MLCHSGVTLKKCANKVQIVLTSCSATSIMASASEAALKLEIARLKGLDLYRHVLKTLD